MNKTGKSRGSSDLLLWISSAVGLIILISTVGLRVRAGDDSYRQVSLFSEVLGLVERQYVDPVDPDELLNGAYEGLLSSLGPEGAYLDEAGIELWKSDDSGHVGVGLSFVKAFGTMQIVSVEEDSPAAEAGLGPGDQIRLIDGVPTRRLSISQAIKMLEGAPGTSVTLSLLLPEEDLAREDRVLTRKTAAKSHVLDVNDGVAVLKFHSIKNLASDDLASTLGRLTPDTTQALIIDVRDCVEPDVKSAIDISKLLFEETRFVRRDRANNILESITLGGNPVWQGPTYVLQNRATAGACEALAWAAKSQGNELLGDETYGLATIPKLFMLESGGGLLVSASQWSDADGSTWNGEGIDPTVPIDVNERRYEVETRKQLELAIQHVKKAVSKLKEAA